MTTPYGTADLARNRAVVDIAATGPRGEATVKAPVVVLGDAAGNLAALTDPVQIYVSNSYANITTKTTTTVKSGAGTLAKIIINKTGSADTLTIYDNTAGSGTLIGTITAPTVGMSFAYDTAFGTGLTIVSGGTTAGDYTVIYR